MRASLVGALVAVGCPETVAADLVERARFEASGPDRDADGGRLLLLGCGAGVGDPADPEDVADAAEQVARSVADDNAEATDRAARGETGWEPYWPLPDRPPRGRVRGAAGSGTAAPPAGDAAGSAGGGGGI